MNRTAIEIDLLCAEDLQRALAQLDRIRNSHSFSDDIRNNLTGETSFLIQYLEKNQNAKPLRSVFRVAVRRHGASCCLREHPYLDMEYWDSYSHFYSRCFRNFSRHCERLHFFTGPAERAPELRDIVLKGEPSEAIQELGFDYLGFVVLRPQSSHCVGRTALLFDKRKGKERPVPPDNKDIEYEGIPRCKGTTTQVANMLCARLAVRAVPFVQQDIVTGMCATASVWTASQIMAERCDLHKFPYLEITRQATAGISELDTYRRGLSPDEIKKAFSAIGAHPQLYLTQETRTAHDSQSLGRIRDLLYTYMESHIPVIVLLHNRFRNTRHAVCCIGHLQPHILNYEQFRHSSADEIEKNQASQIPGTLCLPVYPETSTSHYFVSETLTRFYAHDDAYGPYARLDFLSPGEHLDLNRKEEALAATEKRKPSYYRCPVAYPHAQENALELYGLVVPLPPYIKGRADVIARDASMRFTSLFPSDSYNGERPDSARILWRTVLIKGSSFKQRLSGRNSRYPEVLRGLYSTFHLPKYIWLCEFSVFVLGDAARVLSASDSRPVQGEMIYDASAPAVEASPIVVRHGPYFIPAPDQWPGKDDGVARVDLLHRNTIPDLDFDWVDCFTELESGLA